MPNTAYLATQKRKFEYFFIFYKALFQFFKRKEQECLVPAHAWLESGMMVRLKYHSDCESSDDHSDINGDDTG